MSKATAVLSDANNKILLVTEKLPFEDRRRITIQLIRQNMAIKELIKAELNEPGAVAAAKDGE